MWNNVAMENKTEKMLIKFLKRWSTENYKRMMCLEESFYKDYITSLIFYNTCLKQLNNNNYFTNNSVEIVDSFVNFKSIIVQINDNQPTLVFSFNKKVKVSGNFYQRSFPGMITISMHQYCKEEPATIEDSIKLIKKVIANEPLITISILHEYFHFLFENGLSTEEFKMFNDKTTRSEFNSYTKELMVQLIASNNNKHFETEDDLKKAYFNFRDGLETKSILLQLCNDEKLILDTLIKYNKDFELKESFENSWRNWKINKDLIDINLQSEPLYSTTFEELEHFTQTLEKNLGKTREQIFQEIKETIKNIG